MFKQPHFGMQTVVNAGSEGSPDRKAGRLQVNTYNGNGWITEVCAPSEVERVKKSQLEWIKNNA